MTRFVIMGYGNDVAHFPAERCHIPSRKVTMSEPRRDGVQRTKAKPRSSDPPFGRAKPSNQTPTHTEGPFFALTDLHLCPIVLASLHPAHLTKISWVMGACGEASAVAG